MEAFKEEIDAPNGRKIALEMAYMLPVWIPAQTRSTSGKKRVFFRRKVEWLFNRAHFPLGFEIGRTFRLRLIIMLVVNCAVFLQQRDSARIQNRSATAERRACTGKMPRAFRCFPSADKGPDQHSRGLLLE